MIRQAERDRIKRSLPDEVEPVSSSSADFETMQSGETEEARKRFQAITPPLASWPAAVRRFAPATSQIGAATDMAVETGSELADSASPLHTGASAYFLAWLLSGCRKTRQRFASA
jgi:hypothetical protein